MANSDAVTLDELKTARDAIITGIADGSRVVEYTIRGRQVKREPSGELLTQIEDLIDRYAIKSERSTRSPFRYASLQRPRGVG